MRNVQLTGRIAGFGAQYRAATDDKKAFAVAFINVSLDRKDETTGYTATFPMKLIANAWVADRLNGFQTNDYIVLEGVLEQEADWTNAEGEIVKGGVVVRVSKIDNWGTKESDNAAPAKATPAKASKPAPAKKPAGKPVPPRVSKATN